MAKSIKYILFLLIILIFSCNKQNEIKSTNRELNTQNYEEEEYKKNVIKFLKNKNLLRDNKIDYIFFISHGCNNCLLNSLNFCKDFIYSKQTPTIILTNDTIMVKTVVFDNKYENKKEKIDLRFFNTQDFISNKIYHNKIYIYRFDNYNLINFFDLSSAIIDTIYA